MSNNSALLKMVAYAKNHPKREENKVQASYVLGSYDCFFKKDLDLMMFQDICSSETIKELHEGYVLPCWPNVLFLLWHGKPAYYKDYAITIFGSKITVEKRMTRDNPLDLASEFINIPPNSEWGKAIHGVSIYGGSNGICSSQDETPPAPKKYDKSSKDYSMPGLEDW